MEVAYSNGCGLCWWLMTIACGSGGIRLVVVVVVVIALHGRLWC